MNLPTSTLLRIGSVLLAVTTTAAAVGGWFAINILEASLTLTPDIAAAAEPSEDVLAAIDGVLSEIRSSLDLTGSITGQVSDSTEEVADIAEGLAEVVTGRVPVALAELENSLPALIDTASIVDDSLSALRTFGVPYDPEIPFDEALRSLQEELDGLPEVIAEQGGRLEALVPDIRGTSEDTEELRGRIEAIDGELAEAQTTIADYRAVVGNVSRFTEIGSQMSSFIPFVRLALVVLALGGLALAVAAWALIDRMPPSPLLEPPA